MKMSSARSATRIAGRLSHPGSDRWPLPEVRAPSKSAAGHCIDLSQAFGIRFAQPGLGTSIDLSWLRSTSQIPQSTAGFDSNILTI
ncbi:hypothetical protein PGT21_020017 [Puccinia graminis f. sp. tritici]|uniref:Uncharacterized protein n=1 Tax=Puccinia graminis f. sp. tritici TaxID=56615 RepID=A0A5B0NQP6_PUCGR|nr:hypothetical protein PGT21_020017 [Puccinia graminis f. sp. tritici]KAA1125568.1 hypothetical protein PGTUg99_020141 [Puccinia graminis f. sp. tritici]